MITNNTPFKVVPQSSQVSPPGHSLTVIMKGTFTLVHDGVCTVADEQRDFAPDEPYLDEVGRSLQWASDLAPFKPHTDFYIHGAFHQPNGVAAPNGTASFEFGPLKKTLLFHGPRFARIRDGAWTVNPAKPVVSVPLRWEYSFGGLNYAANPFGKGIDPIREENGETIVELPLIEPPDHPVRHPADRPPPANFAPVPMQFLERVRKRGTYDQRWSTFRAPLPPLDYDPSIHNAAPGDQQGGNFPRGDEHLVLHNLHPKIPLLRTRLPGLRPRVGILRPGKDVPKNLAKLAQYDRTDVVAEEVVMNLDTVVALPEADQLVLLWRGVQPMRQPTIVTELVWMHCELDAPGRPPWEFADIEARMRADYKATLPVGAAEAQAEADAMLQNAKKQLAELDLPQDVKGAAAAENDPKALFDLLVNHINKEVAGIRKRMGLPDL